METMALDEQQQKKVDALVEQLSKDEDIIFIVKTIESRIATTKGYYGDYMQVLTPYDKLARQIMSLAMIKAGGNSYGISWANRLLSGQ